MLLNTYNGLQAILRLLVPIDYQQDFERFKDLTNAPAIHLGMIRSCLEWIKIR